MLIDSHCHLDFPDFAEDFDAVLARASERGVKGVQTICTRLTAFDQVWQLAQGRAGVWCSVGVHPHNVEEEMPFETADIVALAARDKVIGIGETGLDFFYDHSPRDLQIEGFRRHLAASRETGLPVIVHTRDAEDETCRVLREEAEKGALSGVIHCFSAGPEMAKCALDLGFSISFSGIVTFKKADDLRAIAADVPLERILVETDAPYLAPVPNRGKRNEPAFVADTAAVVADIKGVTQSELAAASTRNFFALFSRAESQEIENA